MDDQAPTSAPVDRQRRSSHWSNCAPDWSNLSSPLRPHAQDVALVERALARQSPPSGGRHLTALLFGVTPELAGCRWPTGTRLVGLDRSWDMIRSLWPAPAAPPAASILAADWQAMPIREGSIDVIAGDGWMPPLRYPGQYHAVLREARRVLRADGRFITRVFVRRDVRETVQQVVADLERGAIGSVHALKWRLLCAVHGDAEDGVRLGDVWDCWHRLFPVPAILCKEHGWSASEVRYVDHYRGQDARFHLATLAELRLILGTCFDEIDCSTGTYELAELCPTLVLAPRLV
jgi:SAM-dependent methyltransferase